MKKTIEIVGHGVMLTDYFHGTSGVWINVYINNKTTVSEVIELLRDEINLVWDHVEFTASQHGCNPEDVWTAITEQIGEMENYVKNKGNGNNIFHYNSDLDSGEYDEDEEMPVAIFTIEFED